MVYGKSYPQFASFFQNNPIFVNYSYGLNQCFSFCVFYFLNIKFSSVPLVFEFFIFAMKDSIPTWKPWL